MKNLALFLLCALVACNSPAGHAARVAATPAPTSAPSPLVVTVVDNYKLRGVDVVVQTGCGSGKAAPLQPYVVQLGLAASVKHQTTISGDPRPCLMSGHQLSIIYEPLYPPFSCQMQIRMDTAKGYAFGMATGAGVRTACAVQRTGPYTATFTYMYNTPSPSP